MLLDLRVSGFWYGHWSSRLSGLSAAALRFRVVRLSFELSRRTGGKGRGVKSCCYRSTMLGRGFTFDVHCLNQAVQTAAPGRSHLRTRLDTLRGQRILAHRAYKAFLGCKVWASWFRGVEVLGVGIGFLVAVFAQVRAIQAALCQFAAFSCCLHVRR